MAADACDQLTEAQRECLRLVLSHHNSKEIAVRLKVSPSAVDKRIERAVQLLGAPSRFAAARTLAAHEAAGEATCDRLPCDAIDLPAPSADEAVESTDEPWGFVRRLLGLSPAAGQGGAVRNKLSRTERFGLVTLLAVLLAIATMALLNMGQTLSRLLEEHHVASSR